MTFILTGETHIDRFGPRQIVVDPRTGLKHDLPLHHIPVYRLAGLASDGKRVLVQDQDGLVHDVPVPVAAALVESRLFP
jgi:hypothetical protein